jgi:PTS system fructose-specific IIA component/PTS system nitrogen regulatory IIA component
MGVLLATVAKEAGVIGPQMFVALVVASIVSALLVGPGFMWVLRRRPAFNVLRFFSQDRIVPGLTVTTREAAIDVLVERAAAVPGSPALAEIRDAVHAREKTMGTGIGQHIAVPHARLAGLTQSMVVLGISHEGIDWDAIDDHPAHLIFLLLTPLEENDNQLQILSAIARGLSGDEARRELIHAETADEAWAYLRPDLLRVAYHQI